MQEMRSRNSETGNKDIECSHPISYFSHDILRQKNIELGPEKWEMGFKQGFLRLKVEILSHGLKQTNTKRSEKHIL